MTLPSVRRRMMWLPENVPGDFFTGTRCRGFSTAIGRFLLREGIGTSLLERERYPFFRCSGRYAPRRLVMVSS